MKTLAELKAECKKLGIDAQTKGRASKEPYIAALRDHLWQQEHPGQPIPPQIKPMLLCSWDDLDLAEVEAIESDQYAWCSQEKKDGVRALVHVGRNGIRITGRSISEVTYRLSEFQENLPHLSTGFDGLEGTILDGELVCPISNVDTGDTVTGHPLQAAVAILATSPENAQQIQDRHQAHLRFHAFDLLSFRGQDVRGLSLSQRLELLRQVLSLSANPHLELVPTCIVGKTDVHRRIIEAGGEGTVWKRLDSAYEPGKRVRHWLKRKRCVTVEAVVIGAKPGSPGRGHESLIGAVEFGQTRPHASQHTIAWVSSWSLDERRSMTQFTDSGKPIIDPAFLGRRALISGLQESAVSHRLQHARMERWL